MTSSDLPARDLPARDLPPRAAVPDVSRVDVEERLMAAATTPLADLPHRAQFAQALQRAVTTQRPGTRTAVVFCDLGEPTRGAGHGGAVLAVVAARLRAALRRSDLLAHCGNGRFLALVSGLPEAQADVVAARVASAITSSLDEPLAVHGSLYLIDAAVGSVVHPGGGASAMLVLEAVERALSARASSQG